MSAPDQKELANQFCQEIDAYLSYLKGNDTPQREALANRISYLTLTSAVLPIVITFISAYAYILTQQMLTFFASFVDIVPPILIANTKAKMDYYNKCSDLQLTFTGLKGKINRLAVIGQLKEPALTEIKTELDRLNNTLRETLKINTTPT